ncbi:MAG: hypothetical protein JNM69_32835 [Archangium sp.]|nr:hypothetical protein [Archangium sp.]
MATMLLWLGLGICQMACLLPQDDDILTPLAPPANRPLRLIPGQAEPRQRETTVQLASNCATRTTFSVQVDDPDTTDVIRAQWFIDPNERYIGGTPGNQGVPTSGGSTVRELKAPAQFTNLLGALTDGRKHRVEVLVTDGEFQEDEFTEPTTMEKKPFLKVVRPSVGTAAGPVAVEAYRDEYVWLVEVRTCP